jgi:hypothetical protein
MTPPACFFVSAWLDDRPAGRGALKLGENASGEITRLWTASSARGLGIARKVSQALEARAPARLASGRSGSRRTGCFGRLRRSTDKMVTARSNPMLIIGSKNSCSAGLAPGRRSGQAFAGISLGATVDDH